MSVKTYFRNPFAAALLGAAVVALPCGALVAMDRQHPTVASTTAPPQPAYTQALPDFSALVRQYVPAVVNITVKGNVKTSSNGPRGFGGADDDDPFSQFFRQLPMPQNPAPMRGEGSGFIVAADGVILTNAHVVADAKEVTVKLTDKREFIARVIGQDPRSDVAVLKIDARDLPTVRLGDASKVEVGEWVVAIGAPFGFENSVTQGIVSAKGRTLPDGSYVPFLQTDVAINPGNSGGPLFNLDGEVIGINSQIYSRSGGFQGVSFAIPIDVAMNVSQQLRTSGKVTRGRLGVTIQDVDQTLAESFGLPQPEGGLVANVEKNSPADKAGIKAGDVIIGLNGATLHESSELPVQIAAMAPGTRVKLQVWRDRKAKDLDATLGTMDDQKLAAADADKAGNGGRLGLAVRPLTQDEQQQIEASGGLLVQDVSGPAAEAGIRPGDVVLSANGQEIRTPQQLRDLSHNNSHHIALLIQRGDARIFVPVDMG